MSSTSIELQPRRPSPEQEAETALPDSVRNGHAGFTLPAADRGKGAWLFLAAGFVVEAFVWGFPFSFGVFQDYYQTHEPFQGSSGITIIGTCALGIMYLDFPIVVALQRFYPGALLWGPYVGLATMCLALTMSSFSQTTAHLIVTQGILYGLGGSICYCPCMLYINDWFVQRRGIAYAIMWSGTGTGGFAIPLVLQYLLEQYGFRVTLRIWAVALFVLTAPLVYFIKPRVQASVSVRPYTYQQLGFVFDRSFILYQLASIVESLGYFLPSIHLPAYARSNLGTGSFLSALTVMLINVSTVVGTLILGVLTDKLHPTTCIMISTVGAALGTFFCWGFATNLVTLYVFCIIYGLFAGSYVATWQGIIRQISSAPMSRTPSSGHGGNAFDPAMILAFLTAGRGIGNISSGPLSELLTKGVSLDGRVMRSWGSGYGTLIAFTGITAVIGGTSFIWKRLGWI
ncbi:major facilitator superfamily domain-containing protein [Thelonectria olida]|uniref:Major facilitator superfamily domain-containing protein n=1 Tax=Thelonectria olida TaxID=1576542 RepID=A0A9P8VSZ4_9HYPO|nr:major facilitator superfamily domain-containing protein [Thelonectria olida]